MSCITTKANGNKVVKVSTGVTLSLTTHITLHFHLQAGMKSLRFYRTAAGVSRLKNRKMKLLCSSPAAMACLIQLNLDLSLKNSVC